MSDEWQLGPEYSLLLLFLLLFRANLTKLTLQSDAAMKELQKDREIGEKILRVTEMCRKLETEEEKVCLRRRRRTLQL